MRLRLPRWLRSRNGRRFPQLPKLLKRLKLPRWWKWTLLLLVPLCLVNLTVAYAGRCVVFPLSPFYLRYKVEALEAYASHRQRCVFVDDAPLAPMLARVEQRHRLPCGLLGAIVLGSRALVRLAPAGRTLTTRTRTGEAASVSELPSLRTSTGPGILSR